MYIFIRRTVPVLIFKLLCAFVNTHRFEQNVQILQNYGVGLKFVNSLGTLGRLFGAGFFFLLWQRCRNEEYSYD